MYTLPLRFVKVGPEVAICATRIVCMMAMSAHQARQTFKQLKKSGELVNAAGRAVTKTLVFLDNGTAVGSPFSVTKLMNDLEKANVKADLVAKARETKRLKVYQAIDDFPPEEIKPEDLPFDMSELPFCEQEEDEYNAEEENED